MNKEQVEISNQLLADVGCQQMTEGIGDAVRNYCLFMQECREQDTPGQIEVPFAVMVLQEQANDLAKEIASTVAYARDYSSDMRDKIREINESVARQAMSAVNAREIVTPEQKARDLLERMEVDGAQDFTAGELVELAELFVGR